MSVESEQLENIITITVNPELVEYQYNIFKDKPEIRQRHSTIEAQWFIFRELIERGTATLRAQKNSGGEVMVNLGDNRLKFPAKPLNEWSFTYVISCLFPNCQMGRGEKLVKEILDGKPLRIEIQENSSQQPAIRMLQL